MEICLTTSHADDLKEDIGYLRLEGDLIRQTCSFFYHYRKTSVRVFFLVWNLKVEKVKREVERMIV